MTMMWMLWLKICYTGHTNTCHRELILLDRKRRHHISVYM